MQRLIVALLIVAGAFIVFGPRLNISGMAWGSEKVQDSINKSFEVGQGGLLTVQAEQGSIEVRASNANRIEVDVIRKAEAGSLEEAQSILRSMEIRFEQSGNNLQIVAESPRSRARRQLEFKITVPRRYNVDLKTSGGSIEVEGIEGEARSKTSGGSLQFRSIGGPVTGKTSGGSIGLADIGGDVMAET